MEGIFLYLHLLILQQAVFPVTTQTVTLTTEATFVEDSPGTFHCEFTGAWDAGLLRGWSGPGSVTLINGGLSTDPNKYSEDVSDANANNRFSMTIQPYTSGDEGSYQCRYDFGTSNTITLDKSKTEVHPSSSPLSNIVMQDATNAIDLTIPVSRTRTNASASFNLTSSAGALKVSGDAVVTVTDDGNGRTFSSSLKIDVPADNISANDVFTITLHVGTYSQTRSWTIPESTTNPATTTNQHQ